MKSHIKLIAIVSSIIITLVVIFSGCKKEESSSKLDQETQESFKRLEQMHSIVEQMEKERKAFAVYSNNVIFAVDISYPFAKIGVTNFSRMNNNHLVYQLFDKNELNSYLMGVRKLYFDNRVLDWYSKGVFDCGDYAMGANWYAKAWHRNNKNKLLGASIAVGTIFYRQEQSGIYHAINAIILKDRSIMFIEPQDQSEVVLTQSEIQSINYIQF
jgi:hypothetical protein